MKFKTVAKIAGVISVIGLVVAACKYGNTKALAQAAEAAAEAAGSVAEATAEAGAAALKS